MTDIDWNDETTRRQDALLRDLSSLLAIPSVKDEQSATPGMPLGIESAKALAFILDLAGREGLRTASIDGIVGYAEYDATDEETGADYIAVLCHVDVVPASGEWTSPPFEPTLRDGRLYARGALDDKGPAIAALYGLLIVKELGLPLRHRVRLIVGTDEETGMNCMDVYNRHELPPVAGFTPDADFPIVHAEKGQVNSRMTLRFSEGSARQNESGLVGYRLRSFQAGTAANMVPDRAEAVVQGSPAQLERLITAFWSYCANKQIVGSMASDLTEQNAAAILRMEGKSAHGMAPETGDNAGIRLLEFLYEQPFTGDDRRFIHAAVELLAGDTSGTALGIACCDEVMGPLTVNIGLLRYEPHNRDAYFHLNIRFPVCTEGEAIVANIASRIEGYGFELTPPILKPPHVVPSDHPMIPTLQKIYSEHIGMEATLLSTGGGTYACKLASCVAFGPLFPGEPDTAHQQDESIAIDSLMQATALYARAIYELANLDYSQRKEG
ncbi:dipeptidase PepV [Cohnella mopanensis]|uniref:dipeptidase PepV n=1 Tax=Cohnella mopanensis TaxID=2911966 RepID=UPI001EF9151F|nr:dipeptidase PepV [Cohnella mopanensis]